MYGPYEVFLEVEGPAGIFARPDTGSAPTSYPVPTWSAAKGIFESIAFLADGTAWICPTKVEVCKRIGSPGGRIIFQRYTTNYGGPLRNPNLFKKGAVSGGSSMQLSATILRNVCYRLHGAVVGPFLPGKVNPRHHLQELFNRRLKRGQCFRTPCLGWSEFTCSYWGPFREGITEVDNSIEMEIPSMLLSVWDDPARGRYSPRFCQNAKIHKGALEYGVPDSFACKRPREVTDNAE